MKKETVKKENLINSSKKKINVKDEATENKSIKNKNSNNDESKNDVEHNETAKKRTRKRTKSNAENMSSETEKKAKTRISSTSAKKQEFTDDESAISSEKPKKRKRRTSTKKQESNVEVPTTSSKKTKKRKSTYKKPKSKEERMKNAIKIDKILIGKKLKQIRKSAGLTQEQVAEKLVLAPRYVSDIERDKTKGSLDTLVKLCNIYKVSPSFILRDYISISDVEFINDSLSGYNKLSNYEKDLVVELIHFMNSKKAK